MVRIKSVDIKSVDRKKSVGHEGFITGHEKGHVKVMETCDGNLENDWFIFPN